MSWETARRGARPGLVVVLAAAVLSACASAGKKPELVRPTWPPPPLTARIEFVRNVVSDEDLERDTTFSQTLLNLLAGERPKRNRIAEPLGLAVTDDGGRLYVCDYAQLAVFVFDFAHKTFMKLGESEPLARPIGVALDGEGRAYVSEQLKKQITVFDANGKQLRAITHPTLERPAGVAIDRARGRLYVADTGHTASLEHTVKVFDLNGDFVGKIGGEKGEAPGHFLFPTYVAVGPDGAVYVTDTLNSRVQVFDQNGRYVRSFGERGNAWGMFDKPKGVAIDGFGNVYIADSGWSNVQIFNGTGRILLFFGGRGTAAGLLQNPTALAIDKKNQIYVADYLNHRVAMYRLVNTSAGDSFAEPVAGGGGGEQGRSPGARANAAANSPDSQKEVK